MPISTSRCNCWDAMKANALVVQKVTQGIPISLDPYRTCSTSEMTQDAGGSRPETRLLKCGTKASMVDSRAPMSCGASASDGGRPSGTAAKRNPGTPASAGAARAEEAAAVVLRVDEGDLEAMATVEELGQAERRLHMALRREREEHGVTLALLRAGSCRGRHGRFRCACSLETRKREWRGGVFSSSSTERQHTLVERPCVATGF
jgi:hypothetical protein